MAMSVMMLEGPQGVVRTTLTKTIKLPGTCSESKLRALGRPIPTIRKITSRHHPQKPSLLERGTR